MQSSIKLRRELGKLLALAGPLALYYLTEVAMGLTNMIIVGRLGSNELAAVGLASNMMVEYLLVCFGVLSMVSVLSSQSLGGKNRAAVTQIVVQGFWVAAILSVLAIAFGLSVPHIFAATGQDPLVTQLAADFVVWMMWFIPFALGFVVLRNFLVVLSKAHIVLYVTLPALVLNLLLNYVLVLGAFDYPGIGVAGAGIGTAIVHATMFFALFTYVAKNRACREFPILASLRQFNRTISLTIFKLGTPAGTTALFEGGLFVVVGLLMGTLGADWLAANAILFNFLAITFVIAAGIGEAAAVRIAFQMGAGNLPLVQWNARFAVVLGTLVMACSAFFLWQFPQIIVSIFIDINEPRNAKTVQIAVALTAIAAMFQFFDGLQVVAAWSLRGLKDTLIPMWIASAGYWLCGLGGGYAAGFIFGHGAEGIWWGLATGLIVTAVFLTARLYWLMRTVRLQARISAHN